MMSDSPNKRQKSVLGPIDDDGFEPCESSPPPMLLRRQDTLDEMVISKCVPIPWLFVDRTMMFK